MKVSPEYLAGFFDGEGCCTIARTPRSNGRVEYDARVSLTQKDPAVLRSVKGSYGGTIRRSRNGVHQWTLTGRRRVQRFVDDIYAFSIIKRPALDVIEEFFERAPRPRVRLDPGEAAYRERLRTALTEVNRS